MVLIDGREPAKRSCISSVIQTMNNHTLTHEEFDTYSKQVTVEDKVCSCLTRYRTGVESIQIPKEAVEKHDCNIKVTDNSIAVGLPCLQRLVILMNMFNVVEIDSKSGKILMKEVFEPRSFIVIECRDASFFVQAAFD